MAPNANGRKPHHADAIAVTLDGYEVQSGVNPGFEPKPWTPRRELTQESNGAGLGKYCPRHLHWLTDDEKDPRHYPYASLDPDTGEPNRFCWCCGRPLTDDGRSGKKHTGYGKPCPACGFRRKQRSHPNQIAAITRNAKLQRTPEAQAARRARRVPKVSELLTQRAQEEAEAIMRPYFEALDLRPREGWSPTTALDFYAEQVVVAEKLLDRVEGKPVTRNRHVDAADEDVLRADELSPSTFAQLVAALATGADVDVILDAEAVEEGEFAELPEGST